MEKVSNQPFISLKEHAKSDKYDLICFPSLLLIDHADCHLDECHRYQWSSARWVSRRW